MKLIRILLVFGLTALFGSAASAHDKNAPLNEEQKAFLAQYETVRATLAADDLAAARKAAGTITTESKAARKEPLMDEQNEREAKFAATVKSIATTDSIETARNAFKALSKRAIHYAEGKEGYYLVNCPMVPNDEGNWVQISKPVSNPYFGKAMLTCGSFK